ncbi:DevR family CRISPR-associated autoregulator [uncultured Prevotella sp.]|uniref:DevR family CRISPR-associated autoregulator n=1 Tax=uncultured Prevotella sp. TaxID=159272 RepID=UPI0025E3FBE3|nr:DevR family CRISPR-associated autoregulator [uncultured Prevotella sp.]
MEIKGILVSLLAPFEDHIANGGEKLLGNASSIKRRPDGRVYISGQMQRHVLFSAIDRLNNADDAKGDTFVSNGDGITYEVDRDLRADMGGFMHAEKDVATRRRTAPLSVTPAVAMKESEIGRDLLMRLRVNTEGENANEQAIATREFSQGDIMRMNFFLDITSLSISKAYSYEKSFNPNRSLGFLCVVRQREIL